MLTPQWDDRYRQGKPRWDTGITPPELVEVVEGGQVPAGHALDIGCGTGTNVIYLARHGFKVVGVDLSRIAIGKAKSKAKEAEGDVEFYSRDVLKIGMVGGVDIKTKVDLALDIGCLHSIGVDNHQAYVAMLRRVMRDGGYYLLYAHGPHKRNGEVHGLAPDQTLAILGDSFTSLWVREGEEGGLPSCWYLFRRVRSSGVVTEASG
ncbi:class I SAM-dependent methyltransferase [Chloroflexota bacterium]